MSPASKARNQRRRPRPAPAWTFAAGLAAFAGLGLAAIVALALRGRGFGIDAAGVQRLILAHSFSEHPFRIAVRWDYLFPGEIDHPELLQRPGWPFLLWLSGATLEAPARAGYLALAFVAAWVPAWSWALGGLFETPERKARGRAGRDGWKAVLAAVLASAFLLAQAQGQLLADLRFGGPGAATIFLALLALGAFARRHWVATGAACGTLYYFSPQGELLMLALLLAHFLRVALEDGNKRDLPLVQSATQLGLPFLLLTAPWSLRIVIQSGFTAWPWLTELLRRFLEGRSTLITWYAATDSGLPDFGWGQANFYIYQHYLRHRWYDWVSLYVGSWVGDAASLSMVWAACLAAGARNPKLRAWSAALGLTLALWLTAFAGRGGELDYREFFVLNAAAISWLIAMAADRESLRAWAAWLVLGAILLVNQGALRVELGSVLPPTRFEGARYAALVDALDRVPDPGAPALVAPDEALGVAVRSSRHLLVSLPENFSDAAMLDAFVDRWQVRWTSVGALLEPRLKKHSLVKVPGDTPLWELKPLR